MTGNSLKVFLFIVLGIFISSCSSTRTLPEGDTLYVGSRVDLKDPDNTARRERKILKQDLEGAIRPKPNSTLLGFRLKLFIYNIAGDTSKKGGWREGLRNFGEPPVPASNFEIEDNKELLTNVLQNKGYFYPKVDGRAETKRRKTRGFFDVTTGPQYKIRDVYFPKGPKKAEQDILAQQPNTLLKRGAPYNLDLIKGERERIDKQLKEIGYYYFSPDFLLIKADTTVGDHQVDLYVRIKEDTPPEGLEVFLINNVFIYPNYRLGTRDWSGRDTTRDRRARDTLFYKRYYIVGNTRQYKPVVFETAMQFQPGDLYNRTDQNMALNRLVNMGTFKFVKNDFEDIGNNKLNAFYYLTSFPRKALRAEVGAYTKSDSRTGTLINLSWRHRNAFRGAELLTIRGNFGLEKQFGGEVQRPGIYELGLEAGLTVPRFWIPFYHPTVSSLFVPRTKIVLGYDAQVRYGLYVLHSIRASYGYEWKENIFSEHQLYPINITSVRADTLNKDTTFFITYSNLIFDGLIIGPTYNYTYSTRVTGMPRKHDYYFNGLADFSGNLIGLAQGASLREPPKTIFGTPYAQYLKFQFDFRYYMNYDANPNSIWANRIIVGIGYPYGNSNILPNVKQFFSGGTSSLRGFPSRLVGPGTFYYGQSEKQFIQTSGDIKLELNTELRRQLYSFIHGAVFIDAGNVWTARDTTTFGPGGKFTGKFLSQLAANVGVGIRLDFNILVLRVDLGIPVRKPWLYADNNGFDTNFDVQNPTWRRQNMIFNLGIGYPF